MTHCPMCNGVDLIDNRCERCGWRPGQGEGLIGRFAVWCLGIALLALVIWRVW